MESNNDSESCLVKGLDLIEAWIKAQGVLPSKINRSMRPNKFNYVVRYEIPELLLTDDQIRSFDEFRPRDPIHELITMAKGKLSAEGGRIHAYRSVKGGSCIDVVFDNGEYARDLKTKIARLEEKLNPSYRRGADSEVPATLKTLERIGQRVGHYLRRLVGLIR
ncbi:MAG: hypothetical protein JW893_09320 [Candidatus Omnitrophica bacterium]|nr:hypothetical protein [Candidatus Omnitrophota bacterium]